MVRLLNTRTGEFKEFDNPEEIPYAILSHVWSPKPGGEQSYQDLLELQTQVRAQRLPSEEVLSRASAKIRNACAYALDDGFEWIWIDSSCIDKTSSAELSESINSMYTWYSLAAVCYAYLQDVSNDGDPRAPGSQFRACRWFTRGWTLQELIAPRIVIFCSAEWETLGTKDSLGITIQEITGVGADVLVHSRPLSSVSVSSRMSWAADRITRRKEHEAYCLMGIFGVNMPTIYGEGRRAFVRLQEQILKEIPDQSIFAWEDTDAFTGANSSSSRIDTLFAESPADFAHSGNIQCLTQEELHSQLTAYCQGRPSPWRQLRIALPTISVNKSTAFGLLSCRNESNHMLALVLKREIGSHAYLVGGDLTPEDHGVLEIRRVRAPPEESLRPNSPFWYPWHPIEQKTSTGRGYTRLVALSKEPVAWLYSHELVKGRRWYNDHRLVPQWKELPSVLHRAKISELTVARRRSLLPSKQDQTTTALCPSTSMCISGSSCKIVLSRKTRSYLSRHGCNVTLSGPVRSCDTNTDPSASEQQPSLGQPQSTSFNIVCSVGCIDVHIGPSGCTCSRPPSENARWLGARVTFSTSSGEAMPVPVDGDSVAGHASWCRHSESLVPSWRASGPHGISRSQGFTIPSTEVEAPAATLELTLTCDFPGNPEYPAIISVTIKVSLMQKDQSR